MLTIRREQLAALGQAMRRQFVAQEAQRLAAGGDAARLQGWVDQQVTQARSLGIRGASDVRRYLDLQQGLSASAASVELLQQVQALLADRRAPAFLRLAEAERAARRARTAASASVPAALAQAPR